MFVRQKGPSNRLSSRTSGHKHCRVDKVNFRVEKYILLKKIKISLRVCKAEGPKQSVVESYEWTQALSSGKIVVEPNVGFV